MAMHHAGVSSWHTTHPNSVSANANAFPYDSENEDEEVDQLISDSDDADDLPQGEPTPSTSNKARSKPSTERVPGKSLIPHSRIDNILESDGGGGHMSKEAMFILSIATEEFIKRLAEAGKRQANSARRSTINYRDIASATHQHQEFNFLRDTIPEPISLTQALALRDAKTKELIETNPATSTPKPTVLTTPIPSIATLRPSPPATTVSETSSAVPTRGKGKGRQSNSSKANGTGVISAGTGGTKRTRERKARQNAALASQQNGAGVDAPGSEHPHNYSKEAHPQGPTTTTAGRRRSSRASRDAGAQPALPSPLATSSPTNAAHLNGVHHHHHHPSHHSSSPNGLGLQDLRPPPHSPTPTTTAPPHSRTRDSPSTTVYWSYPDQQHLSPPHAQAQPYASPDYPDPPHSHTHSHPHSPTSPNLPSPHRPDSALWGPGSAGHRPAHFTGPASGFLDDHSRLLFDGRGGGITGNPGRTIYSQQRAPNR